MEDNGNSFHFTQGSDGNCYGVSGCRTLYSYCYIISVTCTSYNFTLLLLLRPMAPQYMYATTDCTGESMIYALDQCYYTDGPPVEA